MGDSIAIYGFNFNEQDEHLILRLSEVSRKIPIRDMANSVYKDGSEKEYMERVREIVNGRIGRNIIIDFYCSESKNCWNNHQQ